MEEKKRPVGRPSTYREEYCEKLLEYFKSVPLTVMKEVEKVANGEVITVMEERPNPPPFFESFCIELGISKDTFYEWVKKHPEFADAYKVCKQIQYVHINSNGVTGVGKTAYSIFFAKAALGMREIDQSDNTVNVYL